jgi:hypothetical protein
MSNIQSHIPKSEKNKTLRRDKMNNFQDILEKVKTHAEVLYTEANTDGYKNAMVEILEEIKAHEFASSSTTKAFLNNLTTSVLQLEDYTTDWGTADVTFEDKEWTKDYVKTCRKFLEYLRSL